MGEDQPEYHDVIVIGAGAAGLRCANQLVHTKGVEDVLVVEASDRIGGRVMTNTSFIPGFHVEMGAEFLHGANTTLTRLAEEAHIGLREIFTWAQSSGLHTNAKENVGTCFLN
ncbi:putative amine oxidase, FAD/NAD(P)-binding domain superfamily [Plasmopara halstedii]